MTLRIERPPQLLSRILARETPGAPAESLKIVAPTVVTPNETFTVKVALADAKGYPTDRFEGTLAIRCAGAEPASFEVTLTKGMTAVAMVHGLSIATEGWHRFDAQFNGRTFFSNPVRCAPDPAHRIYWGDPHVHTVLSDCVVERCRSLQFCYAAARWFAALDFVSAADHVSNGRCTRGKWMEERRGCEAWHNPPEFVTLPGYEASLKGGAGGDNNVYFLGELDMFVDEYEEGSARTLADKLAERLPRSDFMVVPHHTTRTGKHGEFTEAIYPGEDVTPVVEIHSKWGTSEYRGNPDALEKIHPGPSYAVDLLNRGFPLGFIGGTDTHSTMPAGFGDDHLTVGLPGMTAVMTDTFTRENVFRAIKQRRCYAASGERIYLDVDVAGSSMGERINWPDPAAPREVRVTAAGLSDIVTIDLVRNGETIASEAVNDWKGKVAFTDTDDIEPLALNSPYLGRMVYYYVRVACSSGARAWSSPVWLVIV